jgi:hypothetical protein
MRLKKRQSIKIINTTVMMITAISLAGLVSYFLLFINTADPDESDGRPVENMMIGYSVNAGDVLVHFNWDTGAVAQSLAGPDITEFSDGITICANGNDGTNGIGLSEGSKKVFMKIPAFNELNLGGIDVSIDYKFTNSNCSFFSRDNTFDFGLADKKISVDYALEIGQGDIESFRVNTSFTIPDDDEFRNYRFLYDPVSGHAEIMVNGITIWSRDHGEHRNMVWDDESPMTIGKGIRMDQHEIAFLDNLIIKATRQIPDLPVVLLNFEARAENDYVMVQWYTLKENDIDTFIVERSPDAIVFTEIGRVPASGNSARLLAYAMVDNNPEMGLMYYRLIPSNKPVQSVTIPLIGYKYRGKGGDISIDDVKDLPGY